MRTARHTALIAMTCIALSGCTSAAAPKASDTTNTTSATASANPYANAGVTFYIESWPVPGQDPSVEIATPTDRRVYVDISEFENIQRPWTSDDILLASHMDGDHLGRNPENLLGTLDEVFPGQMLISKAGHIVLPDVEIWSIPSFHNVGESLGAKVPNDYIFVIDVGGVRIVHTGDSSQSNLTEEQMAIVGHPDILFTQIVNPFASLTASNDAPFTLIKQLNPRLVIPTHTFDDPIATQKLIDTWPTYKTLRLEFRTTKDLLPKETTVLITGRNARNIETILPVPKLGTELSLGTSPEVL